MSVEIAVVIVFVVVVLSALMWGSRLPGWGSKPAVPPVDLFKNVQSAICLRCSRVGSSHTCPTAASLRNTAIEVIVLPYKMRANPLFSTLVCPLCGERVLLHRCRA